MKDTHVHDRKESEQPVCETSENTRYQPPMVLDLGGAEQIKGRNHYDSRDKGNDDYYV